MDDDEVDPVLVPVELEEEVMPLDPTVEKAMDQAYAKNHQDWMGTQNAASQAQQALNETNRWSMQAAASNQVYAAGGILNQRSAQAQPQSPGGAGANGVPGQLPATP